MNITIPDLGEGKLIFHRDKPYDEKGRPVRHHRRTIATVVLPHEDHSHILARAVVKAYPPDQFTREGGRNAALAKALRESPYLDSRQKIAIAVQYINRPRGQKQETTVGCE